MTHHENHAVRTLKEREYILTDSLEDLTAREQELQASLEANRAAQTEHQSALSDIRNLLETISPGSE